MIKKQIAITALIAGALLAQTAPESQWVALDSSKPGTPADVKLDSANSDANRSIIAITVHGFYVESKKGPDGTYQKITVPGLGGTTAVGSPDLPAAKFNLAIVTGAKYAKFAGMKETAAPKSFAGVQVWPKTIPELDQEGGAPEQFRKNEELYKLTTPWPQGDASLDNAARPMLGNMTGVSPEAYLFKWNPSTKVLIVRPSVTVLFDHAGTSTRTKMTRDRARLASASFVNYAVVAGLFDINILFYEGDFLFIYPDGYKDELQPLIDQKKARGYFTTEKTTTTTGKTCASIRTAIKSWYNSRPSYTDKYALLVGDVDQIPLCTAPTGVPTDDLYADVVGDDLEEEIFVGRLSVDNEADLTNQVTKILTYEDSPSLFCCYNKALLVAHKEGAPGKYVGAHESVRTAAYATPPSFSTLYGSVAGVDDGDVSLAINNGLGLVAYRGHGSSGAWTGWNQTNQYYDSADVTGLANLATQVPVVWSFACTNAALNTEDSIGEIWMEDINNRAVSFYGATVPSFTSQNHELDRQLFKAVYDTGLTIQSHAIKQAEDQMAALVGDDNAWMYLLLGDPEMKIRRRNPFNFKIDVPVAYKPCYGPGCYLNVSVLDEVGNPVPFVKVSAWKSADGKDEVLSNRYTDRGGRAQIPVSGVTAGEMTVIFADDAGNTASRKVAVR